MKRSVPSRGTADPVSRVPILYPRPDYLPMARGVMDDGMSRSPPPPQSMGWDHAAPPSLINLDSLGSKRPRWTEPTWAPMPPPHDRRRDNDQLPPMVPMAMHPLHITPSIPAAPPVAPAQADSDPSSDGESGEKDDDNEPLKKLLGSKKRNRMKDEIDALRKEVGSMTRHLEWLRVSQMHQSPAPLWADIAKQQAHELSRVMAENQHLRHTLEQHLDIAQEYIDTIIPKSVPPGDTVAAPALPIIMCL